MNDTKTEYIVFGNNVQQAKCHHQDIRIGEETTLKSNMIKLLAVHLDMQVTLKEHIKMKSAKVAYNLHTKSELWNVLSKDTTKSLVYAIVSSHMDYCNSVMAGLPMETLKPLKRIQNLAAKLVCRRNHWDSATEALKSLHWLNIEDMILFKVLCIVYRCVNKQGPEFLNEMFNRKETRTLRSNNQNYLGILVTKCISYGDQAFSVLGARVWNMLPLDIRNQPTLLSFRKLLKTELFNKCYQK